MSITLECLLIDVFLQLLRQNRREKRFYIVKNNCYRKLCRFLSMRIRILKLVLNAYIHICMLYVYKKIFKNLINANVN